MVNWWFGYFFLGFESGTPKQKSLPEGDIRNPKNQLTTSWLNHLPRMARKQTLVRLLQMIFSFLDILGCIVALVRGYTTKFQLDDVSWNHDGQNTELLHESSWSVSKVILQTIEPQVNLGYTSRCFLRSLGPSKRQNLTVRVTLGEFVERYCHIKFGASAQQSRVERPKHVNKNYVGGGR